VHHLSFHLFNIFLGKPAQAALRGQRRRRPVEPRVGAVLPGFFINTLEIFSKKTFFAEYHS
jgi:hypothetical protein